MTLVLDSGGVSALAGNRARLQELRRRGEWPPQVPSVVLVESLTGDARRDAVTDRLLALCQVRAVTEELARSAARLRTRTGRAGTISATDAVVAALALELDEPVVVTSDVDDLHALLDGAPVRVGIVHA